MKFLSTPLVRNVIGVLMLMLAWYLPDRFSFAQRDGLQKILPYLMLLSMYGWMVFHNRVLLDKFYFSEKRSRYFLWTAIIMTLMSINEYVMIRFFFGNVDPLPQILGFWVFTLAGAGIYLLFRYRSKIMERPVIVRGSELNTIKNFEFNADGQQHSLPVDTILYIESLENYVKVVTAGKQFLVRMSLKDAELKLSSKFIRISRSHLINPGHIESKGEDSITIGGKDFKIGKVYKKYVREFITIRQDSTAQ